MVMLKLDERGEVNPLTLPFIVVMILAIGFGVFSVWAFSNYNNEKNNVDVIVATAVAEAEEAKAEQVRAEEAEKAKSPYKTYISPSALGTVKIVFPKSWSAYVETQESGRVKLEGYFHPDYVPAKDSKTAFGARVSIDNSSYTDKLEDYQKSIDEGLLSAKAVKVSGATGTRLDGEISKETNGSVVLLPMRDRTLVIWTDSQSYMSDYNRIIDNLTYSP